jgi:hypothetical protein
MMRFALITLAAALPSIPQITEALEKVHAGLGALKSSPEGLDSLQADLVKTIMTLKSDAPEKDKRLAATHVQEEIGEFKQVLVAKQEELAAQSQSAAKLEAMKSAGKAEADANDLFKALMAVQDAPIDQQMAVVKSDEFKELPASKKLLNATHAEGDNLALEVGTQMDHGSADAPPATPKAQLAAIEGSLAARSKRLAAEVSSMDKKEAAREAEAKKSGATNQLGAAQSDGMKKAEKELKFFDKAAHRRFLKARSTKVAEEKELDEAVGAIKKGDVKEVTKILKDLQAMDPHPIV